MNKQRLPGEASNRAQSTRSAGGATPGNGEDRDAAMGPPHSIEAEQSVLGGLLTSAPPVGAQ